MALFLEITEGPQKGTRFRASAGIKIGRTTGEILLDDPKVSTLHAQFEVDAKGALSLVDRGSSNGLHISGQSVQRIRMLPGVRFRVGRTHFLVIKDDSVIDEAPPQTDETAVKSQKWKNILKNRVPQLASSNQINPEIITAFPKIVELIFIQGAQLNQKITLGYGPRRVGRDGLDVEILEPSCPDVAFEIRPEKQTEGDPESTGIAFHTKYPQIVILNGENRYGRHLKNGDQIQIGSTTIEVHIQ